MILHKEIYKDVKNLEDYLRVEKTIPNGEYDRLHSNAKMLAGIILMPMYPFINRAVEIRDDLCKLGGAKKEDLAN